MQHKKLVIIMMMFTALSVALSGCNNQLSQFGQSDKSGKSNPAKNSATSPTAQYHWKMVTTWPRNLPVLGTGANFFAKQIEDMSGGRIKITVYGSGELVGPFEVFDVVARGTVEMGHGASFYWAGKSQTMQLFTAIPFGLTAQEVNAWLHHGGGLELWQRVYAKYGVIPFAVGNSAMQMGGWFNKEINSIDDLKGLRMRIPGLGGNAFQKAGGIAVALPASEVFPALQSGAIDAAEWSGPFSDLALGLHRIAKYYYYPGWQEPGSSLEAIVNLDAYNSLPPDLQSIVRHAARAASLDMLAESTANNNRALNLLINEHNVQLRRFPDDVLNKLAEYSQESLAELAGKDPLFREVYESLREFRDSVMDWQNISELEYLQVREEAINF